MNTFTKTFAVLAIALSVDDVSVSKINGCATLSC